MPSLNRVALINQAEAALRQGSIMQVRSICEELLRADKNDADAWLLLARIELGHGHHHEGVAYLKKCLARHPRDLRYLLTLASAYSTMALYDLAEETYAKALRIKADDPRILAGLIEACEKQGDLEHCRKLLAPVASQVAGNPYLGHSAALVALADGRPQDAADILLLVGANGSMQRASFYLLGKAYEKLKDFDKAFDAYTRANAVESAPFRLEPYTLVMERLMAVFTPDNLARLPRAKIDTTSAVFVTGRPRSGTTLISKIIGAHPQAVDIGEITTLNDIVEQFGILTGSTLPYPQSVLDVEQEDVDRLGRMYIDEAVKLAGGRAARIVNKSLITHFHLGLADLILPGARVIYCRRDPVDTCLACYTEQLVGPHTYSNDLRMLGLTQRLCERLWRHWQAVLKIPVLEVNYEDVVDDQEGQSRRIMEFVGLPWDDACLRFYEADQGRKRHTAAPTLSYAQVRKPIYRTSLGRAKAFEKHLATLHEALAEGGRRWPADNHRD